MNKILIGVVIALVGCGESNSEEGIGEKNNEPTQPAHKSADKAEAQKIKPEPKRPKPELPLTKSDVDFSKLLGKSRPKIHKELGKPSEDRFDDERWDDFNVGGVEVSVRYRNDIPMNLWFMATKNNSFDELKEWAGFKGDSIVGPKGDTWKISGGPLGSKQFLAVTSNGLPKWRPNLNKLLGRDRVKVDKYLTLFKKSGGLYYSTELSVDISISFNDKDGKINSLSISLGEGVDATEQAKQLQAWAKLKPGEEQQRFNGTIYAVTYNGHGIDFQRNYGRYTKRELDKMTR